jgi:uncharacterized protein (DUF302 family)
MGYYFSKTLTTTFEEARARVVEELGKAGFGVLTEIDVRATLRKKLDVEFRPYTILGACNPALAHQALLAEDQVGTMLPCNVVVQAGEGGQVRVAAVDPVASMQAIDNPKLLGIAKQVRSRLKAVIDAL